MLPQDRVHYYFDLFKMSGKQQSQTSKKQVKGTLDIKLPQKESDIWLLFLTIGIIVVSMIRFQLLKIPLERDEGEYAYMGKLILEGVPPYVKAYNMKLPGTYYMYALLMSIFGKTNTGIHTGLIVINACTMFLFYYAIKNVFNKRIAFVTALGYGLMAAGPYTLGFAAHATHFVNFFAALGLLFIARHKSSGKWYYILLSGLMMGMSFLMKQQAVFFILFGATVLLFNLPKEKGLVGKVANTGGIFAAGVFAPYILNLLILIALGAFDKFWFWTYEYASKYAAGGSLSNGLAIYMSFFPPIFNEYFIIWLGAIAGIVIVVINKAYTRSQKIFAIGFGLFSYATVFPGLYFRQHYFITLLPAIGLLAGIAFDVMSNWLTGRFKSGLLKYIPVLLIIISVSNAIAKNKTYYVNPDVNQICNAAYNGNPFIEAIPIGKFIKSTTKEGDKIAILGSEPEIFLYSDRQSATGYIYTYGMVEKQPYNLKMQEEMISEIEQEKPVMLMCAYVNYSWLQQAGTPDSIFRWFADYSAKNYNVVGMVDMLPQGTNYYWNQDAIGVKPQAQNFIVLFKRKEG